MIVIAIVLVIGGFVAVFLCTCCGVKKGIMHFSQPKTTSTVITTQNPQPMMA